MAVLRTRGAQLLMALRLLMALAFHMYAPIWQVSIRRRFNFGPSDHAQFMGLIGLTYALSQVLQILTLNLSLILTPTLTPNSQP